MSQNSVVPRVRSTIRFFSENYREYIFLQHGDMANSLCGCRGALQDTAKSLQALVSPAKKGSLSQQREGRPPILRFPDVSCVQMFRIYPTLWAGAGGGGRGIFPYFTYVTMSSAKVSQKEDSRLILRLERWPSGGSEHWLLQQGTWVPKPHKDAHSHLYHQYTEGTGYVCSPQTHRDVEHSHT